MLGLLEMVRTRGRRTVYTLYPFIRGKMRGLCLFMDICRSDMMMFLSTRFALRCVWASSCRNALHNTAVFVKIVSEARQSLSCKGMSRIAIHAAN